MPTTTRDLTASGATASTPIRRRLAALRLVAQGIRGGGGSTPGQVVRSMLAMQGQDLPGATWSVGLRATRATVADVEAAFDRGEIVRSWPMRGTLHLVAPEDLGWMLELTAPRVLAGAAARRAYLGIADRDVERARDVARASLEGGGSLARQELLQALAAAGVDVSGQRGYHVLWYLAQTGTLVLGPSLGGGQRFMLLDEWVPAPRRLERDEALGELAARYFRGHGPATAADLVRWSGLSMGDVRRGLAVSAPGLAVLELDGATYHLAPETLATEADLEGSSGAGGSLVDVRLLPGFDEYLLGYRDRTSALATEHSQAVVPGGNGMFKPTIVLDGQVVGTWRRRVTARDVLVELDPFEPLPRSLLPVLAEAAASYGSFLGRPARLREDGVAWRSRSRSRSLREASRAEPARSAQT